MNHLVYVDIIPCTNINLAKLICDWIYGNRFKSLIGSYEIIDLKILKHYNQPRIVSTRTKLTLKVDHFTVFESSLGLGLGLGWWVRLGIGLGLQWYGYMLVVLV